MSTLQRRSGLLAGALVTAGLALLPASPATAVDPVPTFDWEISQQFDDHLSTHTLDGGATEDADGVVTFAGGSGSYNPANGTATIVYAGSVKGAFVNAGIELYSVTIANPAVIVGDGGEGQIVADVTATASGSTTGPTRVKVTSFDATSSDWAAGSPFASLTRTPDWLGVIPADSQTATDLGIGAGKPVDGGAFAPEFLGALPSSLRAHFYKSGSGSDPKKAPSPFTTEAKAMTLTKKVAAASPAGGLTIEAKGTGFRGVTVGGDAGIYVGIAEAGGLPDVSSPEGMAAFAGASYVSPGQIVDGAFTKTVNAPTASLDPEKDYALYTWQAHSHSNTSQDTETALPINFDQLTDAPTLTQEITSQTPAGGVDLTVTGSHFVGVTNPGDAGVYVGVAPAGGLPDVSSQEGAEAFAAAAWVTAAQIVDGSFTKSLNVPTEKLDPSKTYAIYTWQAHSHSNTSQDTETALPIDFSQLATTPTVTVAGPTSIKYGAGATLTVTVPGAGTSDVQVKRNGAVVGSIVLTNGTGSYTVPRTWPAGSYSVAFAYPGDGGSLAAAQGSKALSITKAAVTESLRVPVKPTRTKRGQAVVRVASTVAGAPVPTGQVRFELIRAGRVRVSLPVRTLSGGKVAVALPKLGKGSWTLRARYLGSANNLGVVKTFSFKVR